MLTADDIAGLQFRTGAQGIPHAGRRRCTRADHRGAACSQTPPASNDDILGVGRHRRPVERTWAVVTDWERQGEWMPMTDVRVSADIADGRRRKDQRAVRYRRRPASSIRWSSMSGRRRIAARWCTSARSSPVAACSRSSSCPMAGRGSPGRSSSTASGVRRVIDRVGLPPTHVLVAVALRRLARLVAARASDRRAARRGRPAALPVGTVDS